MGRRRVYQGQLNLQPRGGSSWTTNTGTKIYLVVGNGSPPISLLVEEGDRVKHSSVVSTRADLRFSGNLTVTLHNDSDRGAHSYFHLEDNRNTGGCMFATIVCAKLGHGEDCETLQMLREWRDTELTKATYGDILLGQYYDLADLLLPELEEETDMEYFQHLHDAYVQPMVDAIRSKNNPEVISLSRQLVQDVEAKLDAFNNPMINFH